MCEGSGSGSSTSRSAVPRAAQLGYLDGSHGRGTLPWRGDRERLGWRVTRPPPRPVLLLLCALLAAPALASAAPPIPQDPAEIAGLDTFSGRVAKPQPVRAPSVPRHPFMAANGRSNVHNDAYQTDTYRNQGPLGRATRTFSQFFGGPIGLGSCGITIAFDRRGRLVTTCVTAASVVPAPDEPADARHDRPDPAARPRDPARADALRGHRRRLLLPRPQGPRGGVDRPPDPRPSLSTNGKWRRVKTLRPERGAPRRRAAQLGPAGLGGAALVRVAQPRHRGRHRSEAAAACSARAARARPSATRSRSTTPAASSWSPTGRSTASTPARGGRPKVSWRVPYDNVGIKKPGQFDAGSGTTPTLMGRRYLSITDNADPMQVVVMRRERRLRRGVRRLVCEQPVFEQGRERHRELDHRHWALDDRREQLRLRRRRRSPSRTARPPLRA